MERKTDASLIGVTWKSVAWRCCGCLLHPQTKKNNLITLLMKAVSSHIKSPECSLYSIILQLDTFSFSFRGAWHGVQDIHSSVELTDSVSVDFNAWWLWCMMIYLLIKQYMFGQVGPPYNANCSMAAPILPHRNGASLQHKQLTLVIYESY